MFFIYKGHRLGQGREAVREELKTNTALLEEIKGLILQHYKSGKVPVKQVETADEG